MSLEKGRCVEKKIKCRKKLEVENTILIKDSRKIQQKQATISVLP